MDRTNGGAGRTEIARYQRKKKEYRRAVRVVDWTLLGIGGALLLLSIGRDFGSWYMGFLTGGVMGVYVSFREEVPEYIRRHLEGGIGEQKTGRALEPLRELGYVIRHDLRREFGNWDHIVVGPGGVFLIDSKNLGGAASIEGDVVRVWRTPDDEDAYSEAMGPRVRGQAFGLHVEIKSATSYGPWVQGVVCFWNRFDEGFYKHDDAVFTHGSRLRQWIEDHPTKLVGAEFRAVLRYLGMQTESLPGSGKNAPV